MKTLVIVGASLRPDERTGRKNKKFGPINAKAIVARAKHASISRPSKSVLVAGRPPFFFVWARDQLRHCLTPATHRGQHSTCRVRLVCETSRSGTRQNKVPGVVVAARHRGLVSRVMFVNKIKFSRLAEEGKASAA